MFFDEEKINISKIYNVIYYNHKFSKEIFEGNLPTYELQYFYEGDGTLYFNGQALHVTNGDVVYLPESPDNDEYYTVATEPLKIYNIYFDTDSDLPKEAMKIHIKNDSVKNLYRNIYETWVSKRSGYYFKSMQIMYNILEVLYKSQTEYLPNSKLDYLAAADNYIAENYYKNSFNCDELVKLSGISYSYFKKIFIGKYGCPPVKYITRLRVERAKELLRTKRFTVSEISDMCGFENVYYFSNVFKKITGVSPRNYIKGE